MTPRVNPQSIFLTIALSILASLCVFQSPHRVCAAARDISPIIDADRMLSAPNIQFTPDKSSPALIVSGLRDHETDYIVADVYRPGAKHSSEREDGTGASKSEVRTRTVQLHDLSAQFFGEGNAPENLRVLAAPDYYLNDTAHLRLTFWFPCDDPPTPSVELIATPCFFEPIDPIEYLSAHAHGDQRTEAGRKTTFRIHHPPHIDPNWIDAVYDAHEMGTHDIVGMEHLERYSTTDYKGATTRAVCWFPEAGSTKHSGMPVNMLVNMHRMHLGDLHYKRPMATGRIDMSDDQRPTVNRQPEVWYGTAQIKENTHAKLLDPIDRSGHPVSVGKRPYCRSVLTINTKAESEGWTVIGQTRRHRMKESPFSM